MSHKFVIVDEIMDMLESVKSGVVPGSVVQTVLSGIQNVPSNISQRAVGVSSSTAYTTVPISPIVKNCNLDKTYLNLEFDINFDFTANGLTGGHAYTIPMFVGFRDNASIFNQIQLLIENTAIWQTIYQREESVISYNALPETEIRGNNQYASIEKLEHNKYCPMKRMLINLTAGSSATTATGTQTLHFKGTVDINRLTPLLSNLSWTTPHMGNLRLKLFLQNIEQAMFFTPDYTFQGFAKTATVNAINSNPTKNKYLSFYPFSVYFGETIASTTIPLYAIDTSATDNTCVLITSYKFSNPSTGNFMDFGNGGIFEIVQTNFDIKDEEYRRLTQYFESYGSIIIPSQTLTTNVFNNSNVANGQVVPSTMIGNIGGYNINNISVWFHPNNSPVCFQKEYLNNIQCLLEGRPINPLPYAYVNDKCVVDATQAIIDTDHEEINNDYISSLTFLNETDTPRYVSQSPHTTYGSGGISSSQYVNRLVNPNTFCLNFSTNLPDAFHSGACIIENSNRQAVIRFNSTTATDNINTADRVSYPSFINCFSDGNNNSNNNHTTTVGFSSFCDVCIVLNYDAQRGLCYDGQLSWAAPYE